jgi:hypothetical protein
MFDFNLRDALFVLEGVEANLRGRRKGGEDGSKKCHLRPRLRALVSDGGVRPAISPGAAGS